MSVLTNNWFWLVSQFSTFKDSTQKFKFYMLIFKMCNVTTACIKKFYHQFKSKILFSSFSEKDLFHIFKEIDNAPKERYVLRRKALELFWWTRMEGLRSFNIWFSWKTKLPPNYMAFGKFLYKWHSSQHTHRIQQLGLVWLSICLSN